MHYGFAFPSSIDVDGLCRIAKRVEDLGFESIWSGDHIVLPTAGTDQYPYTADGNFSRPPDAPFFEPFTLLSYIAACTSRIKIGTTIAIIPYRHPVVQAKMYSTMDVLTKGRMVCGVGVGWLEKEFEIMDKPYAERGPMTDEYIEIFKCLWEQEDPEYHGKFHNIDGIKFEPKPIQKPSIPIWVGGHTRRALRRTAKYGDAWHPTRQTPEFVEGHLPYLWEQVEKAGRSKDDITISLKRSLHFTDLGTHESSNPTTGGALITTTQQVIDDVKHCEDIGITQLTYDFRTSDIDDCVAIIEHFADKIVPNA